MTVRASSFIDRCFGRASWPAWSASIGLGAITALIALALRRRNHSSWANDFLGWIQHGSSSDSWGPMRVAHQYLADAAEPARLYADVFFSLGIKFQYAPTSLWILDAMDTVFGRTLTTEDLAVMNAFLIGVTILAVGLLGFVSARRLGRTDLQCASFSLGCCIALCFYPLLRAYTLGQLQVWINALFVLACLAWSADRRSIAGVLLGVAVLLKPQFALFGVWALLRREFGFLAAFTAAVAIGVVASVTAYGWDIHVAYLDVLRSISRTGETFHANQSVNGLLNRLLETADSVTWTGRQFPSYHPLVHYGTLAWAILLLACASWVCWAASQRAPRASLLEFQSMALVFTLASPIAWEHHYGMLPASYVYLFVVFLGRPRVWVGNGKWVALTVSCMLTASSLPPLWERWPGSPGNLLQSHLLAGALLLLGMQWRVMLTSLPLVPPVPRYLPKTPSPT